MNSIRLSSDRGQADFGWLNSHHSFSFGNYYDPAHMGVGPLRVINEDRVVPGAGFGTHGHRDMEIISYVLSGALAHKDSIGNGSTLRPGDVQRMSAGTGIQHSEFNASDSEPLHFLQIWVQPQEQGLSPGYEEVHVDAESKRGKLALIASEQGGYSAVRVHQDVRIHAGLFDGAETAELALDAGRCAYVHVVQGTLLVNGQRLHGGDALTVEGNSRLSISAGQDAEVLVFDLPDNRASKRAH